MKQTLTLVAVALFLTSSVLGSGSLVGNTMSLKLNERSKLSANPRRGLSTRDMMAWKAKNKVTVKEAKDAEEAVVKKEQQKEEEAGAQMKPEPELDGSIDLKGVSANELNSEETKQKLKQKVASSMGVSADKVTLTVENGGSRRRLLAAPGAKLKFKVKDVSKAEQEAAQAKASSSSFKDDVKGGVKETTGKVPEVGNVKAAPPPLPKNCGETLEFVKQHPKIPEEIKNMVAIANGKTASTACEFSLDGPGTCRHCIQFKMTCGAFAKLMQEHSPEMFQGVTNIPYLQGKSATSECTMKEMSDPKHCNHCVDMQQLLSTIQAGHAPQHNAAPAEGHAKTAPASSHKEAQTQASVKTALKKQK